MLKAFYTRLKRAFKLGKHFGKWWVATNSIAQGCALSLFIANVLITVWTRVIRSATPVVWITGYVDDRTLRTYDRKELVKALEATLDFDEYTGHKLNMDKTNLASTTPAGRDWARRVKVRGNRLRYAIDVKLLGAHFSTARQRRKDLGAGRAAQASATLRRARMSLVAGTHKKMVAAGKAMPQALYGNYLVGLPKKGHAGPGRAAGDLSQ